MPGCKFTYLKDCLARTVPCIQTALKVHSFEKAKTVNMVICSKYLLWSKEQPVKHNEYSLTYVHVTGRH